MSTDDDLARWHAQLRAILDAVADATRAFGIARASTGIADAIEDAADSRGEDSVERLAKLVRKANRLADRMLEADRSLADVVHPLLGVPGARPEIDLRPWWSRLLHKISTVAQRTEAAESLETLRLEADTALIRATSRLATRAGST
jgi:hypothetical protein